MCIQACIVDAKSWTIHDFIFKEILQTALSLCQISLMNHSPTYLIFIFMDVGRHHGRVKWRLIARLAEFVIRPIQENEYFNTSIFISWLDWLVLGTHSLPVLPCDWLNLSLIKEEHPVGFILTSFVVSTLHLDVVIREASKLSIFVSPILSAITAEHHLHPHGWLRLPSTWTIPYI